MAHLALLLDDDADRRDRFAVDVRRLFSELPGAVVAEAHAGPVSCLWAAGCRAPVDVHRIDDQQLAVLIGYAVNDAGTWVTAGQLADVWLAADGERHAHDGYHVGIAYHQTKGLVVGGDPLGLFPLYYATFPGGSTIVATTPQAFACHPGCSWEIDRTGLAGILFAHGLLDDRPLLRGVRRVPFGHRLRLAADRSVELVEVFRLDQSASRSDEPFDASVERIDAELVSAIRRHRPPQDDALLMLSGGLDSRLMAGCLADEGIAVRTVSFGRPRDYEVRAASLVAARLEMPLELVSTEGDDGAFVARARLSARLSHLSSAPGGDDFALGLARASTTARYSWSGIPLDWVLEPVCTSNGYDAMTGRWSFDVLLKHVNVWGVPRDRLPSLLGRDGEELCRDLIQRLMSSSVNGPLPPERQSAVLRWNQRVRNHLAAALHLTSFVSWPLMVATDRRLFQAAFGLPVRAYGNRRLEKEILVRRRPDLAAVPLDTNSFRFEPLLKQQRSRSMAAAASLIRQTRRWLQPLMPGADPRRYERLFNVDEPRWRNVRRVIEPLRPRLEEVLDAKVLTTVLPGPDRRVRSRSPLIDGSPIRLLAGLAFVLEGRSQGDVSFSGRPV